MDFKELMKKELHIYTHDTLFEFCDDVLKQHNDELMSPTGLMVWGLIEAKFEFWKEGKCDGESLNEFLCMLQGISPLPDHVLKVFLAFLLFDEMGRASASQSPL